MTTERTDGPTPAGGAYVIATWVDLETMDEVGKDSATGIIITEYAKDGRVVHETVGETDVGPGLEEP